VTRQWKKRHAKPGSAPTAVEKLDWKSKLQGFFRREIDKRAKAKAKAGIKYMPNYICARALGNSLLVGLRKGLPFFSKAQRLRGFTATDKFYYVVRADLPDGLCDADQPRRACIQDTVTGERRLALPRGPKPELHTMADCGSIGFGTNMWLHTGGAIRGTHSSDVWAHDLHGSVRCAAEAAGLWLVILEVALLSNYTKGVLNKDANFLDFVDCAADMFAHIDDNRAESLWPIFYKGCAKEMDMCNDGEMGSDAHMEAVLEAARNNKCLSHDGDTVKLARWFSVWDRFEEKLRSCWSFKTMVNVHVGLEKGWFSSGDELLLFATGGQRIANTSLPTSAVAAVEPRSVAQSAAALNSLRHSCECTGHVATLIFSNRRTRHLFSQMAMWVGVTRKFHGRAMTAARNPRKTLDFRIRSASWEWTEELRELTNVCKDMKELLKAQFLSPADAARAEQHDLDEEDFQARTMHYFHIHLMGARINTTSCVSLSFPWKAAALIHHDPTVVQATLDVLKDWFGKLIRLDQESLVDPDAKDFKTKLVWPLWDWVWELLVELSEYNFEKVQ
jgi:hypothetical protein